MLQNALFGTFSTWITLQALNEPPLGCRSLPPPPLHRPWPRFLHPCTTPVGPFKLAPGPPGQRRGPFAKLAPPQTPSLRPPLSEEGKQTDDRGDLQSTMVDRSVAQRADGFKAGQCWPLHNEEHRQIKWSCGITRYVHVDSRPTGSVGVTSR